MADYRGPASTVVVVTVVASVFLSVTVGAVVAVSGTSVEFTLDSVSNDRVVRMADSTMVDSTAADTTVADSTTFDRPTVGYVAVCYVGERADTGPADVTFTFSNHVDGSVGEFLTVSSEAPVDYVVVGGGEIQEEFVVPLADGTDSSPFESTVTLGAGTVLDPPRDDGDPCRLGDDGIKQEVGGTTEAVEGSSPATLAVAPPESERFRAVGSVVVF